LLAILGKERALQRIDRALARMDEGRTLSVVQPWPQPWACSSHCFKARELSRSAFTSASRVFDFPFSVQSKLDVQADRPPVAHLPQ